MATKVVEFEAWAIWHDGDLVEHGRPEVGPVLARSEYAARVMYPVSMYGSYLPVRVRVTVTPIEGEE